MLVLLKGCSRQCDNDAVILYLDAEPEREMTLLDSD
jgi:hypothetical protein